MGNKRALFLHSYHQLVKITLPHYMAECNQLAALLSGDNNQVGTTSFSVTFSSCSLFLSLWGCLCSWVTSTRSAADPGRVKVGV